MADFREYSEVIKEAVKEVNKNATWKWTAKINKGEIKLTNDYIKGQYEKDFFSISIVEDDTLIGKDCMTATFCCYLIGDDRWDDGTETECIVKAIKTAESYFSNRY